MGTGTRRAAARASTWQCVVEPPNPPPSGKTCGGSIPSRRSLHLDGPSSSNLLVRPEHGTGPPLAVAEPPRTHCPHGFSCDPGT
eukprot:10428346-Alexandrium_andersonii.AAC.2